MPDEDPDPLVIEPVETVEPAETPEPHDDAGLDLARTIADATAAAGGDPARRRSRRPGAGAGSNDAASRRSRPRVSGARPDDRDPQLLGGELSRLVGDRGWELPLRMRGVFARWPELVGPDVAGHCTPESFVEGRLVVRTDSTAWATQLTLLAPAIVRRLNEELGPGTVTVIDVQGPHLPSWSKGRRSVRDGRGPRDTYG